MGENNGAHRNGLFTFCTYWLSRKRALYGTYSLFRFISSPDQGYLAVPNFGRSVLVCACYAAHAAQPAAQLDRGCQALQTLREPPGLADLIRGRRRLRLFVPSPPSSDPF